jgi:hypothetical protein
LAATACGSSTPSATPTTTGAHPATTAPPAHASVPPPTAAPASNRPYQMISLGHIRALQAGGMTSAQAASLFNNPHTIVNNGANGQPVASAVAEIARSAAQFPQASENWLFNSFGPNALTGAPGIQGVFGPGGPYGPGTALPPHLTSVSYDPEDLKSNGTPLAESQALEAGNTSYVSQAASLVHARGLRFIFTPSTDVGMTGAEAHPYANKYSTYLAQHRGAWAGIAGVDMFAIQSQQALGTPVFDTFVPAALAQAKAAAPEVPILIGLGINPHDPATAITPATIEEGFQLAQANGAAGYWHNVESGGAGVPPSVYVSFFEQSAAALTGT